MSEPNVTVLCLYRTPAGLRQRSTAGLVVDLHRTPTLEETKAMLRSALTLSHVGLVRHFLAQPVSAGWRESPPRASTASPSSTGPGRCGPAATR
jgi:hypothetical protein